MEKKELHVLEALWSTTKWHCIKLLYILQSWQLLLQINMWPLIYKQQFIETQWNFIKIATYLLLQRGSHISQ